jgi:hypothetical protein
MSDQFCQFLLAGEGIEGSGGCGGRLLRSAMRRDVVVGVDRKSHFEAPYSALFAVMTSITPFAAESKAIVSINRQMAKNWRCTRNASQAGELNVLLGEESAC